MAIKFVDVVPGKVIRGGKAERLVRALRVVAVGDCENALCPYRAEVLGRRAGEARRAKAYRARKGKGKVL